MEKISGIFRGHIDPGMGRPTFNDLTCGLPRASPMAGWRSPDRSCCRGNNANSRFMWPIRDLRETAPMLKKAGQEVGRHAESEAMSQAVAAVRSSFP